MQITYNWCNLFKWIYKNLLNKNLIIVKKILLFTIIIKYLSKFWFKVFYFENFKKVVFRVDW